MAATEQTGPVVRRMAREDIDSVLALDRRVEAGSSLLSHADLLSLNPGGPGDLSFVAVTGNRLAGFMLARLQYLMIPFTEVCVIQGILVDPEYRRRGIGGELYRTLIEHCKAEHIGLIRALVPQYDTELRRFMGRYGFSPSVVTNFDRKLETD